MSLNAAFVEKDAKNKALRTFIQGLGIDIAVAVAIFLSTVFITANNWGDLEWTLLTFTLAKTLAQTVAAYVMRKWLDKSSIPTPESPVPTSRDFS